MALPASVLEAKDMGRERRVRGFYLVTPSTGERVEGGQQGKGRARIGAGRGGYGGAHHGLNQVRDCRRKGIDGRVGASSRAPMAARRCGTDSGCFGRGGARPELGEGGGGVGDGARARNRREGDGKGRCSSAHL